MYEPLTDNDDSDFDEDDDFFLCLSRAKEENDVHSKSTTKVLKQKFSPTTSTVFRTDSPSLNWYEESPSFHESSYGTTARRKSCDRSSSTHYFSVPTNEGLNKSSSADNTDASHLTSSKFPSTEASFVTNDRKSAVLLSLSSSCEQSIIGDKSSGFKLLHNVPVLLSSRLSELSADMFKPLQPLELSTSSDSPDADVHMRDLITPPVMVDA